MFSRYLDSWRSSNSINITLGKTLISCQHYPKTQKGVGNSDEATDIEDSLVTILLHGSEVNNGESDKTNTLE